MRFRKLTAIAAVLAACAAVSFAKENAGTDLIEMVKVNATEQVQVILSRNSKAALFCDSHGRSALHWACISGNMQVVKLLVNAGSSIERVDESGFDAIGIAMTNGRMKVASFLIDKAQTISFTGSDDKMSHLQIAVFLNDLSLVKPIVEKGKEGDQKYLGMTAFEWAIWLGHRKVCDFLWEKEVGRSMATAAGTGRRQWLNDALAKGRLSPGDIKDERGLTLLHWAAMGDDPQVINYLLKSIPAGAKDKFGCTPLFYSKKKDIAKVLIDNGCEINSINNNGENASHYCAKFGEAEVIRYLASNGCQLNLISKSGEKPIHLAANNGWVDVVKFLADQKEWSSGECPGGLNALHLAAQNGFPEITRLLLACGFDPNSVDLKGNSPLHFACGPERARGLWGNKEIRGRSYLKVAALLIEKGSDSNSKNESGETPRDWAVKNGKSSIFADNKAVPIQPMPTVDKVQNDDEKPQPSE